MNVKEYLEQIYKLDRMIKCLNKTLDNLRQQRFRLGGCGSSGDKVQGGQASSRVEEVIEKYMMMESKIAKKQKELLDEMNEIVSTIYELDDLDQQTILIYRYINLWEWQKIALVMHYSIAQTYRLHEKALKSIDIIFSKING